MRVVAGRWKGRRLAVPRGARTRPTADRVREAVFSMLGPIEGVRVLDLFAGSGALGIEALSRGAASAIFVEHDRAAAAVVRRNLETVRAGDVRVVVGDALDYLAPPPADAPFDLVFADPPYDAPGRLAPLLSERLPAAITEQALIVVESSKRHPLELSLPLDRERIYGDTRIAIHRAPE
jgi:16S rRNA (guanine966-N2)-methyltransferase